MADGTWAYLQDVRIGDRIAVECGSNIWPLEKQHIDFVPARPSHSFCEIEALTGTPAWAISKYVKGENTQHASAVAAALESLNWQPAAAKNVLATRHAIKTLETLDEDLASILGYFVGDGHRTKSGICFTCGDDDYASRLVEKIQKTLGLNPFLQWDPTEVGGRWRLNVHSRELMGLLESLGINLRDKARSKKIPSSILRSPKSVMSAFLRGYFDADAYAGREGIRLSSSSKELIRTVQIVLLNYGILSTQRQHLSDIWQLEIAGASAARFLKEIGFDLARKQAALRKYVEDHQWYKKEELTDEIVSIEEGRADVFDITVDEKHAYVANGFINHNSFWHSRIMREMDLPDEDHIEFAELHAGVVSPHRNQLNPYYLGYKIFEDIEKRWDNPTREEQEKWGRKPGEGRAKIFEVRELDNDVSFLRNYLTEELSEELDLFVYELIDEEDWTVTQKQWERVRDQLVSNMTNFGFPYIEVADGDYNRNRELFLRHRYESAELDLAYAKKVLEYVYKLWGRPVHLETMSEEETTILHYDGEMHSES
jgi:stage V sporulation protein R